MLRQYAGSKRNAIASKSVYSAGVQTAAIGVPIKVY